VRPGGDPDPGMGGRGSSKVGAQMARVPWPRAWACPGCPTRSPAPRGKPVADPAGPHRVWASWPRPETDSTAAKSGAGHRRRGCRQALRSEVSGHEQAQVNVGSSPLRSAEATTKRTAIMAPADQKIERRATSGCLYDAVICSLQETHTPYAGHNRQPAGVVGTSWRTPTPKYKFLG